MKRSRQRSHHREQPNPYTRRFGLRAALLVAIAAAMALGNVALARPGAAQETSCPPVPVIDDRPESSFTGELIWRENGVGTFKVSANPRDPKVEVFFDSELTYLQKGQTYRVQTTQVAGSEIPTSNVSCGWTLNEDGTEISTDRIDLPASGLTTLGLAAALGLALAFGLVFILLAIKTAVTGVGGGIRSVLTKRLT